MAPDGRASTPAGRARALAGTRDTAPACSAAWPWAPPVTLLAVGALGADLAGGMNGVRPPEEEGAEAMAPWIPCEIE